MELRSLADPALQFARTRLAGGREEDHREVKSLGNVHGQNLHPSALGLAGVQIFILGGRFLAVGEPPQVLNQFGKSAVSCQQVFQGVAADLAQVHPLPVAVGLGKQARLDGGAAVNLAEEPRPVGFASKLSQP